MPSSICGIRTKTWLRAEAQGTCELIDSSASLCYQDVCVWGGWHVEIRASNYPGKESSKHFRFVCDFEELSQKDLDSLSK